MAATERERRERDVEEEIYRIGDGMEIFGSKEVSGSLVCGARVVVESKLRGCEPLLGGIIPAVRYHQNYKKKQTEERKPF